jgi:hypothetical protein
MKNAKCCIDIQIKTKSLDLLLRYASMQAKNPYATRLIYVFSNIKIYDISSKED